MKRKPVYLLGLIVLLTAWFAEGVGWVKSNSTSDMFGVASSDVIELISYNIP